MPTLIRVLNNLGVDSAAVYPVLVDSGNEGRIVTYHIMGECGAIIPYVRTGELLVKALSNVVAGLSYVVTSAYEWYKNSPEEWFRVKNGLWDQLEAFVPESKRVKAKRAFTRMVNSMTPAPDVFCLDSYSAIEEYDEAGRDLVYFAHTC